MSSGSNTTHSSTHSLSPTPYNSNSNYHHHQQQQQQQQQQMPHQQTQLLQQYDGNSVSTISLDHYGSTSPLHSRQTSSSSSSLNYGSVGGGGSSSSDNYMTTPLTPPPPPPPMPPMAQDNNKDFYLNTLKQHHNATNNNAKLMTKQNENDMNTYNKTTGSVGGVAGVGSGGGSVGPLPTTQKVYNKFLKEYSNKLLTQNKNNHNQQQQQQQQLHGNTTTTTTTTTTDHYNSSFINNNDNKSSSNCSPKPFATLQHKHQHPHQHQHHYPPNNNCNSDNNTSLTPSVAALTATLNNQLKFDSCQVAPTPSSNIPIVDKSLINSNTTTTTTNNNNNIDNSISNPNRSNNPDNNNTKATNDMSSTMASAPSVSEQQQQQQQQQQSSSIYGASAATSNGVGGAGDKPFEYVTLTGNVIRSVVPPGKGTNLNYKVNNQGYARPYGAAPPAAAPKSPVSFPPQQQQQWNAPPPTQPKPTGGNPYATLPRSNVGQGQETITKPSVFSDTLPRKSNANPKTNACSAPAAPVVPSLQQTDLPSNQDPTAMLNASISKINMGKQMDNFMAEAGKVISNMLEARLANGSNGGPSPHSGSSLSLRSNSSSNLSRSPMVVRKRLDLDDFKDINPTEPAALKPVIAVQQNVELKPVQQTDQHALTNKGVYSNDLVANHPMGKVLDICDNKYKPASPLASRAQTDSVGGGNAHLPPSETVIYRNNDRSNRRASHAIDRRSYIESNGQSEHPKDGPVFSISVKALGKDGSDPNKPMSPENEEVVSQLLKDGKKPICCQCNNEITSGPFITALGKIWCPEHFHCVNGNCRRPLQDIGFVEEKGDLYCEYCFEKYLAPSCSKCGGKIKGDCLNAIGKHFHPECFSCGHCGKLFGNTPFFLEDGMPYCEADWNELFTTKCYACGFPVEAGDRWVEALNHNYHSQCFNCTYCKQNLEGQSFYNKGGRPFCKNHAR